MKSIEQIREDGRKRSKKLADKRHAMGLYEVRDIWLPKDKHKAIKTVVNNMYRSE